VGHSKARPWTEDDPLDASVVELPPATSSTPYLDAVRWELQPPRATLLPKRARPAPSSSEARTAVLQLAHVSRGSVSAPTIVGHAKGSARLHAIARVTCQLSTKDARQSTEGAIYDGILIGEVRVNRN
jgi:hypothetical protein